MSDLYVFIDVSGNYDFSNTGTKYLVLTSVTCTDICPGVLDLHTCKDTLIKSGQEVTYFHATEDAQVIRNNVFSVIAKLDHIRIDSVIVEKKKTHPSLQDIKYLYPLMVEKLLQYPFDKKGLNVSAYNKVIIFMDREGSNQKDSKPLLKGTKQYLAKHLKNVSYQVLMHPSMSHIYLQIADYYSWAIFRKWESADTRSYTLINHLIRSEFPIFARGNKDWY
jgi:hypothetical protein